MTASNNTQTVVDDRRSARNEVRLAGTLGAGPVAHAIVALNVSAHGVMLELAVPLPPGRPVTLALAGLSTRRGRVTWVREGHMGVAFDKPLTLGELLAIV